MPETVIPAVASLNELLLGAPAPTCQHPLLVELDGRRWMLYPRLDGSGSWTVALPTPQGVLEPGSELLLPLMPGERFPWVWWARFVQATHPLIAAPPPAGPPAACRTAHEQGYCTDAVHVHSIAPKTAPAPPPGSQTTESRRTESAVLREKAKDDQ